MLGWLRCRLFLYREQRAQSVLLVLVSAVHIGVEHDLVEVGLLLLRKGSRAWLGIFLVHTVSADDFKLDVLERGGLDLLLESAYLSACPQLHTESLPRDEVLLVRAADRDSHLSRVGRVCMPAPETH